MRHIIVDGYNVIRADPRLQALEMDSMEVARDVLVRTLASSPRLANDRICVVFDGRLGTRQHVHSRTLGRIITLYSGRGQTADDVIVARARALRGSSVVVVTNDVELRENCRAAGCEVSGSENLLSQIPGARRPVRPGAAADDDREPTLSTSKKGNARRASKRDRRRREIRF